MLNFFILFLAMLASGAIGFYLARDRYLSRSNEQLHVLGSEIRKMRRRTRDIESQNVRLKTERSRSRQRR